MRELRTDELNKVSGGGFPLLFLGGAAVGGLTSYFNNDSGQAIAASAFLGGLAAVSGGLAASASGLMKAKWVLQSGGLSVASGTISGSGGGPDEFVEQEIEVAK